MTAPGHHHFNQVFYTDVRIPLSNVVGEVNDGWNVAMSTLGSERGTAGMRENIRYGAVVERLVDMARQRLGASATVMDDIGPRQPLLRARWPAPRATTHPTPP